MTDPVVLARALAQGISECCNMAALFAAPRVYASWRAGTAEDPAALKAPMLAAIDGLAEALGKGTSGEEGAARQRLAQLVPATAELRAAVERWDPAGSPDPALTESARKFIATVGMPEPPGGWDDFDPPA